MMTQNPVYKVLASRTFDTSESGGQSFQQFVDALMTVQPAGEQAGRGRPRRLAGLFNSHVHKCLR